MADNNTAYPTVATIIGCPGELSSANGLVATPIISGELQPPTLPPPPPAPVKTPDTSDIKDPIQKAVLDNIYGKLPTKNAIEKFKCEICNVECIGNVVFNTHLNGAKHAKKAKEDEMKKQYASIPFMEYCKDSGTYNCTLCNSTLNAFSQIAAHIAGNKHKNKIAAKDKLEISNYQINNDPDKPRVDATPNLLFCATCNVHLNSSQQLQQHTSSRKHVNKVNGNGNKERPGPYSRCGGGGFGYRGGRGRPLAPFWSPRYNYRSISENFIPAAAENFDNY